MSKYLVIDFNRYDTHKSERDVVEADSPTAALAHFLVESYIPAEDVEEATAYYSAELIHTDEGFSSYAGDENDYLIYKLS